MNTFVPDTTIVAAVQYAPELFDVTRNIATAQQLTFEAAAKGARVIVLPELCMGGHVLRNLDEAYDVCQEKDGYQTQAMSQIAQRFGCHVIFGYVELNDGKLYNSAVVVGPNGVEGNVRKHNLWGSDNLWAQPAEDPFPVIHTEAGRLGVLICRDAMNRYRESYYHQAPRHRFYQKGSVDTIALLTNWGADYGYPDASWVELVEETRANLIVSNRVGKERDMKFKGGSCIVDCNRRIWMYGLNFIEFVVVGGVVLL